MVIDAIRTIFIGGFPMNAQKLQIGNVITFTNLKNTSPFVKFPKDINRHEYIVENASMDGDGYGHGLHDYYPAGWHVVIRKLNPDSSYNAKRKTFTFVQPEFGGAFNNTIESQHITIVKKLKKVCSFVEG